MARSCPIRRRAYLDMGATAVPIEGFSTKPVLLTIEDSGTGDDDLSIFVVSGIIESPHGDKIM